MHSATFLGLWNSLYSMNSALKFHAQKHIVATDSSHSMFHATFNEVTQCTV